MVLVSFGIILVLIGIDQYTKARARQALKDKTLDYGFFKLSLVKNYGAFRGLLKNHPVILLGLQSISVLFVVIFLGLQWITKKDKVLSLGLSFLLAGALGNLIDRIKNQYVTDFFAVRWTKNIYYNIADLLVFVGAILLLLRGKYI